MARTVKSDTPEKSAYTMSFLDSSTVKRWLSPRHAQLESHPSFDAFAQRIKPLADWGDLVLPDEGRQILRSIATHMGRPIRLYERWGFSGKRAGNQGNSAFFAGGSSADRTKAAEVLAAHLKLDLYRIDLGAMASKYVGETEKNLTWIFDSAEGSGAILFFDKADALFGKRSNVKESHDRYANIEVNYLLERVERFKGLAIVATNLRNNLDDAFIRRLRYLVEFSDPNSA